MLKRLLPILVGGLFALVGLISAQPIFASTSLDWRTPDGFFQTDNMTISVNGRQFHGQGSVGLSSQMVSSNTMVLAANWYENGSPMKLDLYFTLDGMWKLTNIKTTDGITTNTYISYNPVDAFNQPLMNGLGEPYVNNGNTMTFVSNSSQNPQATVFVDHLTLNAFLQDLRLINRPSCNPSSIAPVTGVVPLTVTLFGGGSSQYGINGYEWNFAGNGWDSTISLNPAQYTYTAPGTYYPTYLVWDKNGMPSIVCNYAFPIVARPDSIGVGSNPIGSVSPTIYAGQVTLTPQPTQPDSLATLSAKVAELQKHQSQTDSILQRILTFIRHYFPFFR